MSSEKVNQVLTILSLATKYGIPLVEEAVKFHNSVTITEEDVEALQIDDDPEDWKEFWE